MKLTQTQARRVTATILLASTSLLVSATAITAQSHTWRRYAHGGLDVELRDDWDSLKDRPWDFEPKRGHAQIVFVPWLPGNEAQYLDFEKWVNGPALTGDRQLYKGSALTSRKVDGLKAVTYTGTYVPAPSRLTLRETCIGVPVPPGGVVFRFFISTSASGVELDDNLAVYERMLKSMRLDPATLVK